MHSILCYIFCLKVSWSFGLMHAVDGLLGSLLWQLELRNGLASFLRNLYHLPGTSRALDVLDAKVANLSHFQGRSRGSQEVAPILPRKGQRCHRGVEPDKGRTCRESENRECGILWGNLSPQSVWTKCFCSRFGRRRNTWSQCVSPLSWCRSNSCLAWTMFFHIHRRFLRYITNLPFWFSSECIETDRKITSWAVKFSFKDLVPFRVLRIAIT